VYNVSCSAAEHEIIGIAGRNGAGKSTLIKLIAGTLSPASGTVAVMINGVPIAADDLQNHIGLVGPYLALYDEFTPRELLEVTARLRGMKWSDSESTALLERVNLGHVDKRPARGFSSGMLQRLRFAVALQHKPALLLLDEPTSNLDEDGVQLVKSIIDDHQPRGTIFLASNDARELAWCTRIVRLD
jgi:heme exporter protein A